MDTTLLTHFCLNPIQSEMQILFGETVTDQLEMRNLSELQELYPQLIFTTHTVPSCVGFFVLQSQAKSYIWTEPSHDDKKSLKQQWKKLSKSLKLYLPSITGRGKFIAALL